MDTRIQPLPLLEGDTILVSLRSMQSHRWFGSILIRWKAITGRGNTLIFYFCHLPIPSTGKACISPSQGTDALPSGRTSRTLGRVNIWELPIRRTVARGLADHTERTVQALYTGRVTPHCTDLYMFFALDDPRLPSGSPEASLPSAVVGRVKMNITRSYSFCTGEKRKQVCGQHSFLPPHQWRWVPRKDFYGTCLDVVYIERWTRKSRVYRFDGIKHALPQAEVLRLLGLCMISKQEVTA